MALTARWCKIIDFNRGNISFNNDVFWEKFGSKIGDLPLQIISFGGKHGQGKTLLANLIQALFQGIFDDYTVPIYHLENDSKTNGIFFWSEVFFIDVNDDQKIALLLMDTPGLFNKNQIYDKFILRLCKEVSSILLINVSKIIGINDYSSYRKLDNFFFNGWCANNILFVIRDSENNLTLRSTCKEIDSNYLTIYNLPCFGAFKNEDNQIRIGDLDTEFYKSVRKMFASNIIVNITGNSQFKRKLWLFDTICKKLDILVNEYNSLYV